MALHLLSFHIPVLWLKPEIEVVSRDRASSYAEAVNRALPQATQVADRYHLVQNLREHLQRVLDRKRTCLPLVENTSLPAPKAAPQTASASLVIFLQQRV